MVSDWACTRIWGLENPEGFIEFFQTFVKSWDANNLIALAVTWQRNDVGRTAGFDGDSEAALAVLLSLTFYIWLARQISIRFQIDRSA